MPFGQFNAVVISVSQNCPLTKVITYQLLFAIYIGCGYDATAVEILPLLCDPDLEKRCFLRKQATASHT